MRGIAKWLAAVGLACLAAAAWAEGDRGLAEARMRSAFARIDPRAPYACGFASSMVKVFPRDVAFDAKVARWGRVELAGNEVESLQLLVLAVKSELKDVRASVGALTRTDWPTQSFNDCNGDGSVMCAGPDGPLSTIRLENIRDGIEDYEYFWLLSQEVKKLQATRSPRHAEALRIARRALVVGDDLVRDLSHFSKLPEAIYAKRRQVAEAIVECRMVAR